MLCGDPAGMAAAEAAAPWRAPGQRAGPGKATAGAGGGWGPNNSFAYCACLVERFAEADRAFAAARAAAEKACAPEGVATLAVGHSYTLTRMGRLDEALAAINVAVALLDLVPLMEAYAAVGRAYIQLYRGDLDDSARWCQRAEATAAARGELNAQLFAVRCAGPPQAAGQARPPRPASTTPGWRPPCTGWGSANRACPPGRGTRSAPTWRPAAPATPNGSWPG